jgi:pilus assembly protein CpaC
MRAIARTILLSAFCFFLYSALTPATPVSGEFFSDDYAAAKVLDIVLGESKVITVSKPTRVAVGDPVIADVAGASSKELIVSGKKAGETNLQIWDEYGQREITIRVFSEDLGKLKKRLEDLMATASVRGVTFQTGEQEGKVFALGQLPLRKKEVVDQLLQSFKDKLINLVTYKDDAPLVQIDVQVLEISKRAIDNLGIKWTSSFTFNEVPGVAHTLNRQVGDLIKAVGQSKFDRTTLTTTLNLLEQDNLARTLARPKLVALSGKEAKFLAGGQVPVLSNVSVTGGTTTTAVEYVDYGIKLNIKPEVKETGAINCRLEVEIKTIDTATQLTVQTGASISTSTPGFKTRTVTSELTLNNEETIFLAGLIDNNESNNLQRVPGLGNLPIVGALFRSKDFQLGDTELVISLTPKIVNYGDMLQDIRGSAPSAGAAYGESSKADYDPADAYMRRVQDIILKSVGYPMEAQRANLSGSLTLSLHLDSSGQLTNVVVNETSGHQLLDKSAVYTVKRLAPYPPFPKDLMLKEIWVEVPINYQLN